MTGDTTRIEIYFDMLVESLNSRDGTPAELARLVRVVLDEAGHAPRSELSCWARYENLLLSASIRLLDKRLGDLLQALCMTEIAPKLVHRHFMTINSVAQAVASRELEDVLSRSELTLLENNLQVRGKVLELVRVSSDAIWFDRLCAKFPTLVQLKQQTWEQLNRDMALEDDGVGSPDTSQRYAVQQVWSAGYPLREKICRYGLAPEFADFFVSNGLENLDKWSEQELWDLQRGKSVEVKRNLHRLWRLESAAGLAEEKQRTCARKDLRDITQKTIAHIATMKRHLHSKKMGDFERLWAELGDMMATLGFSAVELPVGNTAAVVNDLDHISSLFGSAFRALGEEPELYRSDEEIIANVSAGEALRGVFFGMSSKEVSQQPIRRLLQTPAYCPLLSPMKSVDTRTTTFRSTSAVEAFRSAVLSSEETLKGSLKVSAWGVGGVKVGGAKLKSSTIEDSSRRSQRATSLATVTYGFVPVKALRLSREQMKLSLEAKDAILAIATPENARRFLLEFGSHVPCGIQHLGGIFWKSVETQAEKETEKSVMDQALTKGVKGTAKLKAFGVDIGGGSLGGGYSDGSKSLSSDVIDTKFKSLSTHVECIGPNVASYELFSRVLEADSRTWRLIDRGSPADLVPVWDLIDGSLHTDLNSLSRIKSLLRDAWLNRTQREPITPDVRRMSYREQLARNNQVDSTCLLSSEKDKARNQVEAEIETAYSLPESTTAEILLPIVERVFAKIDRYDFQFNAFLLADILRGDILPALLERIATKTSEKNPQSLLSFLAVKLDGLTQQRLLHADPPVQLSPGILAALENSKAPSSPMGSSWYPQRVDDLRRLPSVIRAVVDGLRENSSMSTSRLTKRVGEYLVLNLWETDDRSELRNGLLDMAKRFYCSADGFLFPLTEDSCDALLEEFERIITPSPSPSYLPFVGPLFRAPPMLSSVVAQSEGNSYSYTRIDRTTPDVEDLPTRLLYALMHRLDIQSTMYKQAQSEIETTRPFVSGNRSLASGTQDARSRRVARSRSSAPPKKKGESVFDAAIQLQASNDVAARSEVHRLLLDRRFLTPFIAPASSSWTEATLACDVAGLELVETVIDHDGEDLITSNLISDVKHLRVAVISQRPKASSSSKDWINMVFHVNSLHAMDCENKVGMTMASTAAEIGWGFLSAPNRKYVPVVLLHVIGDYRPLKQFIASYCDAIVVDAGDAETIDMELDRGCVIKWSHADPDEEDEIETSIGEPLFIESLRCRFTESTQKITRTLIEQIGELEKLNEHVPLTSAALRGLAASKVQHIDFESALNEVNFTNVRAELQMQVAFAQEAHKALVCQREKDPMKLRAHGTQSTKLRELRQSYAMASNQHQLIVVFRDILQISSPSARVMGVLDLERFLTLRCEEQSALAHKAYRSARDAYHDDRTPANSKSLAQALDGWDKQSVQLVHLWRELSQLYAIDTKNHRGLAMLAAQHLLDGFALELMNGDAGVVNLVWIKGVFKALKSRLGSARVLVLSVMGVQSSGKSTLLNYMFGVRLRTSVSRCTRGVSIQLLKCEGRLEYEYVILLDTEGIRAPERIGMDDGVWLDNRMAALSILPADATIILTKGESTITINEILPIVLSAYLESDVAQKHGGRLPSKLLFVFNQIDLAEKSKLETIVDSLMHELNANAKKVAEIRHGIHVQSTGDILQNPSQAIHGANVFKDLNYTITDEENSDVRVLGTIKAQSYPPHDAPLPDYGERLQRLRDHIHRRVCESEKKWKSRTIDKFGRAIATVWKCIECSNFQLNFIAAYERINYDKLVNRVNDCVHRLTAGYHAAFDTISIDIRKQSDKEAGEDVKILDTQFCDALSSAILKDESILDAEMRLILSEERFSKWATDQQCRWDRHKVGQAIHWRKQVQGQVDNVFRYEMIVGRYKKELRNEANALFNNGGYKNFTDQQIAGKFTAIFNKIRKVANKDHPPMYRKVRKMVHRVFYDTNIWALSRQARFGTFVKHVLTRPHSNMEINLKETILGDIQRVLGTVNRYDDATVLKCIKITESILVNAVDENAMRVTDDFKEEMYVTVMKVLCKDLKAIQRRWDEENSVAARFEASMGEMRTYFNNLGRGFQGMRLLQNIVLDWLKRNIGNSFLEELVADVGLRLKGKRWVSDAKVMQAMIDNSLVELIEANGVGQAIDKINSPLGHIDEILSSLIRSEVRDYYKSPKPVQFVQCLIDCVQASAARALETKEDRAVWFLRWLRSSLYEKLPSAATNCLLASMPHAIDGNINCDDQPQEIFDVNDSDFVCKPIIDFLERAGDMMVSRDQSRVTANVLEFIRTRAHGASSGVMPRCGEPCPICKSPCTRELGHVTSEGEKLHDTYHQPIGLTGWRNTVTFELDPGSCLSNSLGGQLFRHTDKVFHQFKDFHKVHSTWSQPIKTQPLQLREYIFYNFQDELVARHPRTRKCTKMPIEYNHSLEDIKLDIRTTIS